MCYKIMNLLEKPDESDCCNSGCNPCILDVYEEELEKYSRLKHLETKSTEHLKNCLSPTTYAIFKLISKLKHTENTFFFSFEFVKEKGSEIVDSSGFHIKYASGQHFLLKGENKYDKNSQFTRAYTPIPFETDNSLTFTTLVRLYEFGEMSYYLKKLKIGEETLWRGPYCDYKVNYTFKNILFIAQGTGIAPIYSVINNILNNPYCETRLQLYFCCKNANDILLRNQLHNFCSYWNFNCHIFLTQNGDDDKPKYKENLIYERLSEVHLQNYFSNKMENSFVLICGTKQFSEEFKKIALQCGISDNNVYVF